jgi:hypothetical protein
MRRILVVSVLGLLLTAASAAARPTILRTPNGGVQPQAVIDAKGVIHLVYLKGREGECDVFYARKEPGKERFSEPIRVNSVPGSAIATGTIRGAQIALGKDNRVHVVWNGSGKATPRLANAGIYNNPMCYARLNDAGRAFEPQRNLMTQTNCLDGGGTVAADSEGNVYVAWHAPKVGGPASEATRQVWLALSTDNGKTFAREVPASTEAGCCGCCGMKGFVDSKGALHLLYRTSANGSRDIAMLTSTDHGKSFTSSQIQRWRIEKCPMSSEAFAEGPDGFVAAWETENQIYFGRAEPAASALARPSAAPGNGSNRKHPALAVNDKGETMLVWTEGTDWNKGGALVWQVLDKTGRPTEERGRVDGGIPVWGLPTVVAGPNGFVIIH